MQIIGPDAAYVRLGIIYTVAISLLALATPISVQLLINSVANTALPAPLWALSGVLLLLLLMVAGLSALRVWIMAAFERRVFSRVVAEVTVRAVHAQNPFFGDANRSDLFNRYFANMSPYGFTSAGMAVTRITGASAGGCSSVILCPVVRRRSSQKRAKMLAARMWFTRSGPIRNTV